MPKQIDDLVKHPLFRKILTVITELPVWAQLGMLVAIPGLISVVMLSSKAWTSQLALEEAERINSLTEIAVAGSELVHELQKERGMSAGFIGSSGAAFTSELSAQRLLVDAKRESFKSAARILNGSAHDKKFVTKVAESLQALDALTTMRDEVSTLNITVREAVTYFSNVNASILAAIARLSHLPSRTSLSLNASALGNFSNSKERAGLERAVLSVVFSQDKITNEMRARVAGLIESQMTYLNAFEAATTPQGLAKLEALRTSEGFAETQRLRKVALSKSENFGVESTYWFGTITQKINAMRTIEAALANELISEANALAASASRDSRVSIMLLVAAISSIVITCWIITLGFRSTLGEHPKVLAENARRLADGSFAPSDKELDSATGLSKTLCEVQRQIDERAKIRLQALERSDQLKQCLDKLNTPVLATDSNFQIAYTNAAMLEYLAQMREHFDTVLTQARSGELIGSNVGIFGENVEKLHQTLSVQNPTLVKKSTFGTRIVNLSYSLVVNNNSQTTGITLEILDITDNENLLREVSDVVDSASRGILDVRVTLSEKLDASKELSERINTLIEINEDVISSIGVVMADFANGKLKAGQKDSREGKYAEIMDNTQRANEQLIQIVSDLQSSAGAVASNASEISRGIEDLRNRTENSAASLESTSNSMRDIAVTVKDNATLANQASELTSKAQADAKHAGEIFDNAIKAMEDISDSSGKIAEITSVIDEIAFQTNLLALNASVEAARAGEQGRGFAVVASEVRNLAGRSAMSAKEIKSLIEDSVKKVADGRSMVVESGESLQVILESVDKVDRFVSDIDHASRNQTTVIENIQDEIQNLSDDTQRNAALVEQASTASLSSKERADTLLSLTDFFTITRQTKSPQAEHAPVRNKNANAA